MKKRTVAVLASAVCSTYVAAESPRCHEEHEHNHFVTAQRPYHQAIPTPLDNSPYRPSDTMPAECKNETVEAMIRQIEAGQISFATAKSDDTIPEDRRSICLMYDDDKNIVENPTCDVAKSRGFIWKEISDWPTTIGMTNSVPSDGNPHYHGQPECYYALRNEAMTYAENEAGTGGEYTKMVKGQYFYIPGNAIHATIKTSAPGYGLLYWYPQNGHFDGFKYFYPKHVKNHRPAEEAFELEKEIRMRDLGLKPVGQNQEYFDKIKAEAK